MKSLQKLDTNIHAGVYAYFIVGKDKVVGGNFYMIPAIIAIVGYSFAILVEYRSLRARVKYQFETVIYFICANFVGFAHLVSPYVSLWIYNLFSGSSVVMEEDLPEQLSNSESPLKNVFSHIDYSYMVYAAHNVL
jgi:hypothetical protein